MKHKSYRLKKPRSRKKKVIFLFLVLAVIAAAGGIWFYRSKHHETVSILPKSKPAKTVAPQIKYTHVNGKYLFSGTIMLGRAVQQYANGNYYQPFSGMSTLGTYDDAIGVLECPVTGNTVSYQTQVNDLVFNCEPAFLPALKKYFPIINLSSNHLEDQGAAGYSETVTRLTNAGFQTVGNYNPHAEKDDCKAVVLPVHLQQTGGQETDGALPIAICSYNYKELFSPEPGELQSIQKWSQTMPVIGLMNGGPEYEHTAGTAQVSVAHQMIDYGADFVVGNGTHWIQNTEVYKGKLIVYSMGNFIFDQLDLDGRLALNLSVEMTVPYNNNVGKWLEIGNSCKTDTTNCLTLAQEQGLTKINAGFKFNVVASYGGFDQITTLANSQDQAYMLSRSNWNSTEQTLSSESQ